MAKTTKTSAPAVKYVLSRGKAPIHIKPGEEVVLPKEVMRQVAAMFGAMGGAATKGVSTPAKRRAARENGKKGGRPRKNSKKAR